MINMQESITAKLCSFARAYHSNFAREKIFDDYLAFDIMGKEEYENVKDLLKSIYDKNGLLPESGISNRGIYDVLDFYLSPIPLSRIAYTESKLLEFSEKYGKCQYVICGSGMDTFAFRNTNKNIVVYELDHHDTQRYKMERLKQLEWNIPKNVKFVPVNFDKESINEALEKHGFDTNLPTFCSILGVTYYLTLPVFSKTIQNISNLTKSVSKVVFDYPDETTFQSGGRVHSLTKLTEHFGEPMKYGYSFEDVQNALKTNNFQLEKHLTPEKIQKKFFSGREDGQSAFENIHFVSAEKKTVNY